MGTPNFDLTAAVEAVTETIALYLEDSDDPVLAKAAVEAALPHLLAEKDAEIEQIKSVLASMDHFAEVADRVERRNNTLAAERDETLAEVDRLRGVVDAVPQWVQITSGYHVTTGERVRCEFGTETDDAVELTASETMEGNPVRHLFRGQDARYYRAALLQGNTSQPEPIKWHHFRWFDNHLAVPRKGSVHETRRSTTEAICDECDEAIGLHDAINEDAENDTVTVSDRRLP